MANIALHSPPRSHESARLGQTSFFPLAATSFALLLAWTLLLRWPSRHYSHPDDGFFAETSWLWLHGAIPYVNAFDVKPPGYFIALAGAQLIFGPTLAASQAIGALSDALTATLLFWIARRYGAPVAGGFAAALFPFLPLIVAHEDGYEFLIAETTLAMAFALSGFAPLRKAALAGLAIGAACMTKQTAIFEAGALVAILAVEAETAGQRARVLLAFALGAAIAPIAVLGYFASRGALGLLLTDIVGIALLRPGADGVTLLGGLGRFLHFSLDISPLIAAALLVAIAQLFVARPRPPLPALGVWLGFALAGVLFQRAIMFCYLAPLLPPSLLLTTIGLGSIWPRARTSARWTVVGLCAMAAVEVRGAVWLGAMLAPIDFAPIEAAAAAIKAAHPRDEDRLFITNALPAAEWIYTAAGVRPASRYLIPIQTLCDFPTVGPGRIAEIVASRPRFTLVNTKTAHYFCELDGAHEIAAAALRDHYRLLARVGSGEESYDIYEVAR